MSGFIFLFIVLGVLISQPEISPSMNGMLTISSGESAFAMMSLLGASIMPHNFFLHSSIVQVFLPSILHFYLPVTIHIVFCPDIMYQICIHTLAPIHFSKYLTSIWKKLDFHISFRLTAIIALRLKFDNAWLQKLCVSLMPMRGIARYHSLNIESCFCLLTQALTCVNNVSLELWACMHVHLS